MSPYSPLQPLTFRSVLRRCPGPTALWALSLVLAACGSSGPASDAGLDGSIPDGSVLDGSIPDGSVLDAGLLAAGQSCQTNASCGSGVCGVGGVGHCCTADSGCPSGGSGCGALDCDGLGACIFPTAGEPCGAVACVEGRLQSSACDGQGSCQPGVAQGCPGHFGCASASSCAASCEPGAAAPPDGGDGAVCAAGFRCDSTGVHCVARQVAGGCDAADVCLSGLCLGHTCCAAPCLDAGACAAQSCDLTTGACDYPGHETPCGAVRSCSVASLTSDYCDGQGQCGTTPSAQPCPHALACQPGTSSAACNAVCAQDSDCAPGNLCAPPPSSPVCCPQIPSAGELWVDAHNGADQGCCGSKTIPCATLTFAMALIADSRAADVTVHAENVLLDNPISRGQSYGQWRPVAGEPYPVHLGWGVTLEAPSLSFYPPANTDVFDVYPYPDEPRPYHTVTIAAPPGASAWDSSGSVQEAPPKVTIGAIDDQSGRQPPPAPPGTVGINDGVGAGRVGLPLVVSGATLTGTGVGLDVGPGGAVTLGPGPVTLVNGGTGIRCRGEADAGASVADVAAPPSSNATVVTLGAINADQSNVELEVDEGCSASLTQSPQVGWGSSDPGSVVCDFLDQVAVRDSLLVSGNGRLLFGNEDGGASIQCPQQTSVHLAAGDGGAPQVTLLGTTLTGAGCAGVLVEAGQFVARGSQFNNLGVGVYQAGGTVDLSTVGGGGPNSFSYAFESESLNTIYPPVCPALPLLNPPNQRSLGYGVVNVTRQTANLAGALFGDFACSTPPAPTEAICDATFTNCVCQGTDNSCGGTNGITFNALNGGGLLPPGNGLDLLTLSPDAAAAFNVTRTGPVSSCQ